MSHFIPFCLREFFFKESIMILKCRLISELNALYCDWQVSLYQDYKVLKESGQSDVWQAVRKSDNMKVALKKFRGTMDRARTSLSNELMALQNRSHNNVIDVLDYYEEPHPCLVMKFIEGKTLSEYLENNKGPLPIATAMKILRDIGDGLKYIHENNVVHRDMKPANIILEDKTLKAVLIDFGLGKTAESTSMMQSSSVPIEGSYLWMAPEILKPNKDVKCRKESDVYAVGIIMWQIFTGKKPYEDENFKWSHELIAFVTEGNHNRPSLSNIKADPHLIRLMQKCWDANYKERPSMKQFLDQLPKIDSGQESMEVNATREISLLGESAENNSAHFKELSGAHTELKEFSTNLSTNNSIATVKNDPSSFKNNPPNSSAMGKKTHGTSTDNTVVKTALGEVTESYDTDSKNIQAYFDNAYMHNL